MDIFLLILRLLLAGVFGAAGIAKLFDRAGTEKAFKDFGAPDAVVGPSASVLPVVELAVALALLFVGSAWYGSVGAATLLIIFLGGMFYQLAKGNAPDCHCFGQLHSEPVGATSVIRNIVLLGIAGFLLGQGNAQGLALVNSGGEIMQLLVGLTLISLAALGLLTLNRISEQQQQISKRIELLELVSHDGRSVEREDVSHPGGGLPIGTQFPDFNLKGINGQVVTLTDIKAADLPAIYFFVSPTCDPCGALVPEFEKWQKDLAGKANLVFVSNGTPEANLEKFGADVSRQLLLQENRELSELVQAKWTPTALLVTAKGGIASHVAAGDAAIRKLVESFVGGVSDTTAHHEHHHHDHDHDHAVGETIKAPNKMGTPLPEFSFKDIRGNVIDTAYFRGKRTLLLFWSLECGFCKALLPDLVAWDLSREPGEPELVVFSDGDEAANKALGLRSPIVTAVPSALTADLGMLGTPSAVLVDEQAVIASETAMGAPNLWALVGHLSRQATASK
jgi:peroxiredoxin